MTDVLITIDTEMSAGRHSRGWDLRANYESSILGRCDDREVGIGWQMDRLEEHGLKGVFFVDPMPALVRGESQVADMVRAIVTRGHEVQLHIHTEWLQWASASPVGDRHGRNLADFPLDDQVTLVRLARDLLVRAGAPRPIAFRAGNYGANDDSIRALAKIGIGWDSSLNPSYLGGDCRISASIDQIAPFERDGVTLLPVSALCDRPGSVRHAQICALSQAEMRAALFHAEDRGHPVFVIVTHSFEMLSRDRKRANLAAMRRFSAMCRTIGEHQALTSRGFHDLDRDILLRPGLMLERLPPDPLRTAARMAGQAIATWRYERRLFPA